MPGQITWCLTRARKSSHLFHRLRYLSTAVRPAPQTPIQLVALDVDGTLLDNQRKVHPRVKDAIVKTAGLGVPVLLSTGRCPAVLDLVNAGLDVPLPLSGGIFLGGAVGLDAFGKVRRNVQLPADVVQQVLLHLEAHALTPVIYNQNDLWCVEQDKWTRFLIASGDPAPKGVGKHALRRRAEKANLIALMGPKAVLDGVEESLATLLEGSATQVVRPFKNMLDVVRVGGKAEGLAELCTWRGIPAEAVMAVGDSGNDVDMLRWAGWAVAMGNASPSALAAADAVVAKNDDPHRPGVAEALEEFVIKVASG